MKSSCLLHLHKALHYIIICSCGFINCYVFHVKENMLGKCLDLCYSSTSVEGNSLAKNQRLTQTQAYVIITTKTLTRTQHTYVGYWRRCVSCDFRFENCETANNMGFKRTFIVDIHENNTESKQREAFKYHAKKGMHSRTELEKACCINLCRIRRKCFDNEWWNKTNERKNEHS